MTAAWETRAAILSGATTAEEVLEETFAGIERAEPALHAFLTIDREHAAQQTRELRERAAAGEAPGPLWGIPVSVKDTIATAGLRTTYGSRTYADNVPTADADVVTAIRRAGGVVVGKTNTPEFAIYIRAINDLQAETRNPWDTTRISGGSSGGAAASTGAGLTPLALGSDGGGSIRIPAALCGSVGLLPSRGAVATMQPGIGTRHFSAPGPLARDARDARALYEAIAWGVEPSPLRLPVDAPSRSSGGPLPRLRWVEETEDIVADAAVTDLTHGAAVDLARAIGWSLDDDGHPMGVAAFREPFYDIMQADRYSTGGSALYEDPERRELLTDYGRHQFERGSHVSGAAYSRAIDVQFEAVRHMSRLFDGVEFLLSPTVPFTAPAADTDANALPEDARRSFVSYTFLMNFVGLPAVTIPCGLVDGLPVGLQIIGRHGTDAQLLELAVRFQELVYRLPEVPDPVTSLEVLR